MSDRLFLLNVFILLSLLMTARCRPTVKGDDIPRPLHERSKKHNVFTLAAPPSTAALLPAVDNMVLMPNGVPAALGEAVHHMFHQHPLNIPYIPGALHGGEFYGGLHNMPVLPWHHYGGLYEHAFTDPYMYHGPALLPVHFHGGYPSYVLDHSLSVRGDNSPGTVFLGARSTLPHPSVPHYTVQYHYPYPHYAQLNGNGKLAVLPHLPVQLNDPTYSMGRARSITKRGGIAQISAGEA